MSGGGMSGPSSGMGVTGNPVQYNPMGNWGWGGGAPMGYGGSAVVQPSQYAQYGLGPNGAPISGTQSGPPSDYVRPTTGDFGPGAGNLLLDGAGGMLPYQTQGPSSLGPQYRNGGGYFGAALQPGIGLPGTGQQANQFNPYSGGYGALGRMQQQAMPSWMTDLQARLAKQNAPAAAPSFNPYGERF